MALLVSGWGVDQKQYMGIIGVGLGIMVIIDTIVSPCSAGKQWSLYTPLLKIAPRFILVVSKLI